MFADNVSLTLDGVLYLKIVDPFKASYGVEVINESVDLQGGILCTYYSVVNK
jgi:hypothetical protein